MPGSPVGTIFIFALLLFLIRRFSLARREETRLSSELESAHSIQRTFVPPISASFSGYDLNGLSLPSEKVGGEQRSSGPSSEKQPQLAASAQSHLTTSAEPVPVFAMKPEVNSNKFSFCSGMSPSKRPSATSAANSVSETRSMIGLGWNRRASSLRASLTVYMNFSNLLVTIMTTRTRST